MQTTELEKERSVCTRRRRSQRHDRECMPEVHIPPLGCAVRSHSFVKSQLEFVWGEHVHHDLVQRCNPLEMRQSMEAYATMRP